MREMSKGAASMVSAAVSWSASVVGFWAVAVVTVGVSKRCGGVVFPQPVN